MKFSVLTFNLEYSRGLPKLLKVLSKHEPDIVTVQEFDLGKESVAVVEKQGYTLADYAESFKKGSHIYGLATFHKKESFTSFESHQFHLPRSMYEVLWFIFKGGPRRTVISTTFKTKEYTLSINNVHFSPFAANTVRNKQLEKTLKRADDKHIPTIVLGDFNYPYKRSKLEKLFNTYNFKEATNGIFHTFYMAIRWLPIKFKLDYILYRNLKHIETHRIDGFSTDHTPILASFEF